MFSRTKTPTISLSLHPNGSPSNRRGDITPTYHHGHAHTRRIRTRYMAYGLFAFLIFVTIAAFTRASPLILKSASHIDNGTLALVNAAQFQSKIEAMTEIYRGKEEPREDINHLIVVTGHAILLDKNKYLEDEAWVLEPFQKGGQVQTFVDHIVRGVDLAKDDEKSLLVFSGGETRPVAGPRSEGQSYWNLANHLFRNDKSMEKVFLERVVSEEFARDSYENLLFSLCRFFEMTGRYPEKLTVVGFGFKEKRFTDLHRKAVRFPKERFFYVGIDPLNADVQQLTRLEHANAAAHFENDPYACSSPVLAGKRLLRNPFRRMHGYGKTNPALLDLLSWCPEPGAKNRWYDETTLPWELPSKHSHQREGRTTAST